MSQARWQLAALWLALLAPLSRADDWLGPLSTVNEPRIAGREVQLDARGRLLPWPYADDPGRSYDSPRRAQWVLLLGLFRHMPAFPCCFQPHPAALHASAER